MPLSRSPLPPREVPAAGPARLNISERHIFHILSMEVASLALFMSRKLVAGTMLHLHFLALLLGSTGVCAEVAFGALALPQSLDAAVVTNRHRRVYCTLPKDIASF